jgi:hypothetical protein
MGDVTAIEDVDGAGAGDGDEDGEDEESGGEDDEDDTSAEEAAEGGAAAGAVCDDDCCSASSAGAGSRANLVPVSTSIWMSSPAGSTWRIARQLAVKRLLTTSPLFSPVM